MKKIIVIALALACSSAFAVTKEEQCNALSQAFSYVIGMRDDGIPPKAAFAALQKAVPADAGFNDGAEKSIVNEAYFNPAFQGAPTDAIAFTVFDRCVHPRAPIEPLK